MPTIAWKSGVSGDWGLGANWNGGVVPADGDNANFGGSGTDQVTIDNPEGIDSLTTNDAGATIIDNAALTVGGTLDVRAGTFVLSGGQTTDGAIVGGSVKLNGGQIDWEGGTLSGVTYDGVLNVGADQSLMVSNGLTVTGVNGSGPGVINLTNLPSNSIPSSLLFEGSQTLDNVTVDMSGETEVELIDPEGFATLTLGPSSTLEVNGSSATLSASSDHGGASIVNNGTVIVGNGGGLQLTGPNDESGFFKNNATIHLEGGSVLTVIGAKQLANLSGHTLTGGLFELDAGGTMVLGNYITRDDSTIILNGPNSVIEGDDADTSSEVTIDQELTYIGSVGTLEILGGRNFGSTQTVANHGTLDLGGGVLTEASIVNYGAIEGFGLVSTAVANTGTLSADGGLLEFADAVGSGGRMVIGAQAMLRFDASATAFTATFSGTGGTLALADPTGFTGRLADFSDGDTLDLIDIKATAAARVPGNRLQITDNGATVATLALTGSYVGDTFMVASDGAGGSDVVVTTPTVTLRPHVLAQAISRFGAPVAGSFADPLIVSSGQDSLEIGVPHYLRVA